MIISGSRWHAGYLKKTGLNPLHKFPQTVSYTKFLGFTAPQSRVLNVISYKG